MALCHYFKTVQQTSNDLCLLLAPLHDATSLNHTEQTEEISFFISFDMMVKSYQAYKDISEPPRKYAMPEGSWQPGQFF